MSTLPPKLKIYCFLLCNLILLSSITMAQDDIFVRAFPTDCHGFDPAGRYLITDSGTYSIETQEKIFEINDGEILPIFSPTGSLVAFQNRLFDALSLELILETSTPILLFSPDEHYLADESAVYNVHTQRLLFEYTGSKPKFSPDSQLFVSDGASVYQLATGQALYPIFGDEPIFSPDSQYVGTNQDYQYSVLDAITGEILLSIQSGNYFPLNFMGFSHNGEWVFIPYDHVYEIATGDRIASLEEVSGHGRFSSSDEFLLLFYGVYETSSWQEILPASAYEDPSGTIFITLGEVFHAPSREIIFTLDFPYDDLEFSPDNRFIVTNRGIYNIEARQEIMGFDLVGLPEEWDGIIRPSLSPNSSLLLARIGYAGCLIYDYTQGSWVPEYGILYLEENSNIRTAPRLSASVKASDTYGAVYIITGISENGDWYRILFDEAESWVAAECSEILYITDAIPVIQQ